jgi:hypothetical protein
MTVLITLTTAGADSGPFDLYSNLNGYTSAFESGVSKAALLAGYPSALVPDYTNIIRVKSNGTLCTNYTDIDVITPITPITTTTTTSSTTTTTTTVSPIVTCTCYDVTNVGYVDGPGEEPPLQGTGVIYRDCNGDPASTAITLVGGYVTICAETGSVVTLGDPATIEPSLTNCCEPWDSLTAIRENAVISSSSSTFIPDACAVDLSGNLSNYFIATQTPSILSVGDRVFTSNLPNTNTFDGTKLGIPNYWALYLSFGTELCTFGLNQVALIDNQGFILEVQCCPVNPN